MPSANGRPRMIDVAQAAGVSQATVSFVLNDRQDIPVAAPTRRRILRAADDLGYRVNRAAREFKLSTSTTIGVVSFGVASHPFAGAMLLGIQSAARARQHVCMVVDVADDPDAPSEAVASLLDRGVRGLVFASPASVPVPVPDLHRDVNTVFSGCWPERPAAAGTVHGVILPNEFEGGRAAARIVLESGRRDLLFMGGTRTEYATIQRERGFDAAVTSYGLDPQAVPRVYGDYSTRTGYELTLDRFSGHRYDAIICGNDQMALGALLALQTIGLSVPSDVGLVGYDDQEALAAQLTPSLTTIALPHRAMGDVAVRALLESADNERLLVDCAPVLRNSTSAPTH